MPASPGCAIHGPTRRPCSPSWSAGPQAGYFAVRPDRRAARRSPSATSPTPGARDPLVRADGHRLPRLLRRRRRSAGRAHRPAPRARGLAARAHLEFAPRLDYGRAATGIEAIDGDLVVRGVPRERIRLHAPGVYLDHRRRRTEPDRPAATVDLVDGDTGRVRTRVRRRSATTRTARRDRTSRRHHRLLADLGATLQVPRPLAPTRCAARAHAAGPLPIKPIGRHPRRRHHQPARGRRRRAQLGLPLLLAPRRVAGGLGAGRARQPSRRPSLCCDWLLRSQSTTSRAPSSCGPLYPLAGDEFLPEAVLPTLNGYLGSRPVRIGNAADHQVQLDVFGPVVDLVWRLAEAGVGIDDETWQLVSDMVAAVSAPLARTRPRHLGGTAPPTPPRPLQGDVLAGRRSGDRIGAPQSVDTCPSRWRPLRAHDRRRRDLATAGTTEVEAYTIAYGDTELDAAVLWIGLSGSAAPPTTRGSWPRSRPSNASCARAPWCTATASTTACPGDEGGFLICTAWLIEAYVMMGQLDDARTLFDRYLDLAGPHGPAQRAVRAVDRHDARQPPPGVLTSGTHQRCPRPPGNRLTQGGVGTGQVALRT